MEKSASPWAVTAVLLSVAFLGLAGAAIRPATPARHIAAVFPPWWSAADAVSAVATADGEIVSAMRWPTLVTAYSPDPAFADRLRAAGALLLLDAAALTGCGLHAADAS